MFAAVDKSLCCGKGSDLNILKQSVFFTMSGVPVGMRLKSIVFQIVNVWHSTCNNKYMNLIKCFFDLLREDEK